MPIRTLNRARMLSLFAGLVLTSCQYLAAADVNPLDFVSLNLISDGDPETDDRGWAKVPINATSFKTSSLFTVAEYQFTSFYGADRKLIIGRRSLVRDPQTWTLLRTAFTSFNIDDSHNVSSLAIDGDGFLHIAWGVHNNPLLYTRSTSSILNDQPFHVVGEKEGNAAILHNAIPLQDQKVTYPEFYNIPGSKDLLLTFRTMISGNGKFQLVRWQCAEKRWISVHASPNSADSRSRPWIDNDYAGDALPNVSAYCNKLVFDDKGRLHTTWCWRTGADSLHGFKDYQTNHNLMYAYSDNQGVDWHRADGTRYQRDGSHVIDEENAPPVLEIAEGSSLINQTSTTVDSNGHFYTATWYAPDAAQGNHLRQYMLLEYDGHVWKAHQIGIRNEENRNQRIPENQLSKFVMRRPVVLADEQGRLLVVFSDRQRGGGMTVAYSEETDRRDWRFVDLTTQNIGRSDPTYDPVRWKRDGILSLYHQPSSLGSTAEPASLLEWNAREYFASVRSALER